MTNAFDSKPNRQVTLSLRSRFVLLMLRFIVRPILAFIISGSPLRWARLHGLLGARHNRVSRSANAQYQVLGESGAEVCGHVLGDLIPANGPVLLWIHGGAWIMPVMPETHIAAAERLRLSIGGSAFLPEYRLLPGNPYPASLDDCSRAYDALLSRGYSADQIVIGGDSAGGNMTFALLHRLKAECRPMPVCAVGVAPATVMDLVLHGSPSRIHNAHGDAVLPARQLIKVVDAYCGTYPRNLPEISPLYGDFRGFPPAYLIASAVEFLRDDAVMLANRLKEAGCDVRLDIWEKLPHIFSLTEDLIPEARQSREDIAAFIQDQLARKAAALAESETR